MQRMHNHFTHCSDLKNLKRYYNDFTFCISLNNVVMFEVLKGNKGLVVADWDVVSLEHGTK